jgi:predicted nuclease of predicted toxin-antitoxin system
MRFKLDENLPLDLAGVLRSAGHNALTVEDQHLSGTSDSRLFEVCRSEGRTLLTLDTDFADIREYAPGSHNGIVVFRLGRSDKKAILGVVLRLLTALQEEPVGSNLWVVSEDRIRVRGPHD